MRRTFAKGKKYIFPSFSPRQPAGGFTLIEILIVVAIIGILASVVLVGLGPVQRQGRDARRISDLRQVQNALELYFNKNGNYPNESTWAGLKTAITGAGIGILTIPSDPKAGTSYTYQCLPAGVCSGYQIGATLEDVNNPALVRDNPCTTPVYCIQF